MPLALSLLMAFALDAAALPVPSGPLAVGRVTAEWTDRSRMEPLAADHGYRTLVVDVWYPAAESSTGKAAPYLDAPAFERAIGAGGLRRQLGDAYDAVKGGRVQTHAVEDAPFSRLISRAPLLVFSPGGGMVREAYSAQLADLASHGYIVAAITHPYDGIVSVYQDGHTVTYDSTRWPQVPSIEGEWNLNQLDWHTRDIKFVLDKLEDAKTGFPFSGHLDMRRIGAFGHSFGGVAAAQACQSDARIQACLNQDGEAAWRPFNVNGGRWRPEQQFMLIERAAQPAPAPDKQAEEFIALMHRMHDIALQSITGGSYEVTLDPAMTTHMSFSDLPLLGAQTNADADSRAHAMAVIRGLTRAFFDQTLRGKRSPLLDKPHDPLIQSLRRFGPAAR